MTRFKIGHPLAFLTAALMVLCVQKASGAKDDAPIAIPYTPHHTSAPASTTRPATVRPATSADLQEILPGDDSVPAIVRMQQNDADDARNSAMRSAEREPDVGTAVIRSNNGVGSPFMVEDQSSGRGGGNARRAQSMRQTFQNQQVARPTFQRPPGVDNDIRQLKNTINQINFNNSPSRSGANGSNGLNGVGAVGGISPMSFPVPSSSGAVDSTLNGNVFNNKPKRKEQRDPLAETFDTTPRKPDRYADNPQPDSQGVRHFPNGKHFDLSKMSIDQAIAETNDSLLDPRRNKPPRQNQNNNDSVMTSWSPVPQPNLNQQMPYDANIIVPYRPHRRQYNDAQQPRIPNYRPFDDSVQQIRPHHRHRRDQMDQIPLIQNY